MTTAPSTGTASAHAGRIGWRTRRPRPRATTSAGRSSTRRCGRACSSPAALRVEHNDSFGTAVGAAWLGRLRRAPRRRQRSARRRLKATAGTRHQGADACSQSFSLSPFFSATRSSSRSVRRASTPASSSGSPRSRASVELTWFDNRYRDIISTQTISFNPFTSQYFNIGLTRRGAPSSAARSRQSRRSACAAGYTCLDSEVTREHLVVQQRVRRRAVAVPPAAPLRIRRKLAWTDGATFADLSGVVRRPARGQRLLVARATAARRTTATRRGMCARAYRVTGRLCARPPRSTT